jgi:hypothetical protein
LAIISSPSRNGDVLLLADFKPSITSCNEATGFRAAQKGGRLELKSVPTEPSTPSPILRNVAMFWLNPFRSRGASSITCGRSVSAVMAPLFFHAAAQLFEKNPLMGGVDRPHEAVRILHQHVELAQDPKDLELRGRAR